MIRGMVPPERLLEWSAEHGWEPLCNFLGKEVPDEPFPHLNTASKGWQEREKAHGLELAKPALRNMLFMATLVVGGLVGAYMFPRH